MKVKLSSNIETDSIVDGEGLRTVIWMQGCFHDCRGCHNPETHDINSGIETDIEDIFETLKSTENQSGITLSGGDPMYQPEATLMIAEFAHSIGLNVWCYTGFTYEELVSMSHTKPIYINILKHVDVLVDGKFELVNKSLNCKYRGSSNQRIIDVPLSLIKEKVILKREYYETNMLKENKSFVFI